MGIKGILKDALAGLKPDTKTVREAEDFLKRLDHELKKKKLKAKATAGGSYAKNTWLKEDYDVDIFVKFDLKYRNEDLSKLLAKALKPFKPETIHGSRDYYWVRNSLKFEIIPVLDIKKPEQAQNVTDFSPWHVSWVNKHGKKYTDEIRLAKKFLKVCEVYGAESYIKGFSGHVVDILIIYYKGFTPLLRAAAKWKPKVIIDFHKQVGKKAEMVLNKSKVQGPLIVIDPVQPNRNAAAAVSQEMFDEFVSCAREFLKKPSEKFFEHQKIDWAKLAKKGKVIIIDVDVPKGKEDPTGTKLIKAFQFIMQKLADFEPSEESGWSWDKKEKAMFGIMLKRKELPETYERSGPPIEMTEGAAQFKKKHKKTYVNNGRICAKIKYEHRTPEELLEKEVFKDSYLKEKVKKCKLKSLS